MNEVERVFREESGRILAGLLGTVGDFDLVEEALQEALVQALERWPQEGLPASPAAWVTTVARRRCLDLLRERRTAERYVQRLAPLAGTAADRAEEVLEQADARLGGTGDDLLRLLFTCCHPALSLEAQVALTLKTVAGLPSDAIARAFLVSRTTLEQRLVRAKRKIHEARIPYRVPPPDLLPERLEGVTRVIYLVFNEGYAAASGAELQREALCEEAIRLARSLVALLPATPESEGLLALLLLQHSRRRARVSATGELVVLEEQDRSLWDRGALAEGLAVLDRALARGQPGPYQIQAAIAALHARAPSAGDTDWPQIAALYGSLRRVDPSPVVALNEAVAVAFATGWDHGLERLRELEQRPELRDYLYLHAARADLLRRAGHLQEARRSYDRALALCHNDAERRYLERRRREVEEAAAQEEPGSPLASPP